MLALAVRAAAPRADASTFSLRGAASVGAVARLAAESRAEVAPFARILAGGPAPPKSLWDRNVVLKFANGFSGADKFLAKHPLSKLFTNFRSGSELALRQVARAVSESVDGAGVDDCLGGCCGPDLAAAVRGGVSAATAAGLRVAWTISAVDGCILTRIAARGEDGSESNLGNGPFALMKMLRPGTQAELQFESCVSVKQEFDVSLESGLAGSAAESGAASGAAGGGGGTGSAAFGGAARRAGSDGTLLDDWSALLREHASAAKAEWEKAAPAAKLPTPAKPVFAVETKAAAAEPGAPAEAPAGVAHHYLLFQCNVRVRVVPYSAWQLLAGLFRKNVDHAAMAAAIAEIREDGPIMFDPWVLQSVNNVPTPKRFDA